MVVSRKNGSLKRVGFLEFAKTHSGSPSAACAGRLFLPLPSPQYKEYNLLEMFATSANCKSFKLSSNIPKKNVTKCLQFSRINFATDWHSTSKQDHVVLLNVFGASTDWDFMEEEMLEEEEEEEMVGDSGCQTSIVFPRAVHCTVYNPRIKTICLSKDI